MKIAVMPPIIAIMSIMFTGADAPPKAPPIEFSRPKAVTTAPNLDLIPALSLLKSASFDEAHDAAKAIGAAVPPLGRSTNITYLNACYIQAVALMRKGQFSKAQAAMEPA